MKEQNSPCTCPMDSILRLIMGPWTTYILWLLATNGTMRFGELKARVGGISAKVLTDRLRHLEAENLVHRDYKPTVPPAVSYSLTERGMELREALENINRIALRWAEEDAEEQASKTRAEPAETAISAS